MKLNAGGSQKYLAPLKDFGKLRPIHRDILVVDMNFDEQFSNSGIWLGSDDGKQEGLRPRWGLVYEVGPEQDDVSRGQWIMVEHGRWTRGIDFIDEATGEKRTLRKVDPDCLLMVSDEDPTEYVETYNPNAIDYAPDKIRAEDFGAN